MLLHSPSIQDGAISVTLLHLHFRVLDAALIRNVSVGLAGHQYALSSS